MQEIWFEGYGRMGYFVGLYGALRHKAAICHQWQIFSWQNWQEAIIMQSCKGKFSFDTNIFYLQQEIVRCQGGRSWSLKVRCLSESSDPQFLVNLSLAVIYFWKGFQWKASWFSRKKKAKKALVPWVSLFSLVSLLAIDVKVYPCP